MSFCLFLSVREAYTLLFHNKFRLTVNMLFLDFQNACYYRKKINQEQENMKFVKNDSQNKQ